MQALLEPSSIRPDVIESIVVAGNTTMEHLLWDGPARALANIPSIPYRSVEKLYRLVALLEKTVLMDVLLYISFRASART